MTFPDPPLTAASRPWLAEWGCVLAGAAGAGALLILVGTRAAAPLPGVVAVLVVALVTLALTVGVRRANRALRTQAPAAEADLDRRAALASALEGLPDPLLVLSGQPSQSLPGGRVLFANTAAREFLRIQGEGAPLATALRHPEVLEVVDKALVAGLAAETAYQPGGARDRYWRALARPLPPGADGSSMALLLLTDETDARRNERMRADFLANASHELRTPLASLTGFIETLRGHAKDDPAARDRFLEIMAAQADRMARLVADLLSLSRIELNEHIAPAGSVDLALAVADVLDASAPQASEAGVALRKTVTASERVVIDGDRDQILQVVQNLIDNAVKYTPRGGEVAIEVGKALTADEAIRPRNEESARMSLLSPDRSDRAYALLRVTDSGPGIAREHLPRLTERFYRVEGQKSGERSGTGLGLAIVKHIVNRHRGGLAVETVLGHGATFLAYLPLAPAPAEPAPARHETVA